MSVGLAGSRRRPAGLDKDPDVHLYNVPSDDTYLCVVAAPADQNERFVVTAYFTENIKKGKELWTS